MLQAIKHNDLCSVHLRKSIHLLEKFIPGMFQENSILMYFHHSYIPPSASTTCHRQTQDTGGRDGYLTEYVYPYLLTLSFYF